MDILGIGPLELFFIFILALIIFGPEDLVKAGKSMGSFMRKVVKSDGWRAFNEARKGMSNLPNTLMREAGLEEEDLKKMTGLSDLEEATQDFDNQISPWVTPPKKPGGTAATAAGDAPPEAGTPPEAESVNPPEPPPGSPFSQTIDNE